MSQWIHVCGCLELNGSTHDKKFNEETKKNLWYIPYPDEQIEFETPVCYKNFKDGMSGIEVTVQEYSLPRCRSTIEKAIKQLPCGSYECIQHNLYQTRGYANRHDCSGNYINEADTKVIFEQYQKRFMQNDYKQSYDDYKKSNNFRFSNVETVSEMVLSICDDVRDSDIKEFLDNFELFCKDLCEDGITIGKGIISIIDEWQPDYIFEIRCATSYNIIKYLVLDKKTGTVKSTKELSYDWNVLKDKLLFGVKAKDNNWDNLIK